MTGALRIRSSTLPAKAASPCAALVQTVALRRAAKAASPPRPSPRLDVLEPLARAPRRSSAAPAPPPPPRSSPPLGRPRRPRGCSGRRRRTRTAAPPPPGSTPAKAGRPRSSGELGAHPGLQVAVERGLRDVAPPAGRRSARAVDRVDRRREEPLGERAPARSAARLRAEAEARRPAPPSDRPRDALLAKDNLIFCRVLRLRPNTTARAVRIGALDGQEGGLACHKTNGSTPDPLGEDPRLTFVVLAIWFVFSLLAPWYARELDGIQLPRLQARLLPHRPGLADRVRPADRGAEHDPGPHRRRLRRGSITRGARHVHARRPRGNPPRPVLRRQPRQGLRVSTPSASSASSS